MRLRLSEISDSRVNEGVREMSRAPIYGMELVRRAVLGLDPLT